MKGRTVRAAVAIGLTVLATAALPGYPAEAASAVPYTDAASVGFIALYDPAGKPVTSGRVADHPFVAKAVGSQRAPALYDGAGRTATLLAYQPREGASPTAWSGDTLTASGEYPDPAHPTAQAGTADFSLQDFLDGFPARWNGLIQVRLYLGAPNQPALTSKYASTDLLVAGGTWTVVGGGPGAGPGGTNIPGSGGGAAGSGGGSDASGASGAFSQGGATQPGSDAKAVGNPLAAALPGTSLPGMLAVAAGAVVLFVGLGVLWRRRSKPQGSPPAGGDR